MRCARCAGLRIPEILSEGGTRVPALRCIHCGDIVDRVILRHRSVRRYPEPSRARTPTHGRGWKKKQQTCA
jgi:hypothetical protein